MNPSGAMTNPEPPPARPLLLMTRMLTTLGAIRRATALIVFEYESSNSSSCNGGDESPVHRRPRSASVGFSESERVIISTAPAADYILRHVNVALSSNESVATG